MDVPLVHRRAAIGRWTAIAWDPQRFLAPYAKDFVDDLVVYCRRNYPANSSNSPAVAEAGRA